MSHRVGSQLEGYNIKGHRIRQKLDQAVMIIINERKQQTMCMESGGQGEAKAQGRAQGYYISSCKRQAEHTVGLCSHYCPCFASQKLSIQAPHSPTLLHFRSTLLFNQ